MRIVPTSIAAALVLVACSHEPAPNDPSSSSSAQVTPSSPVATPSMSATPSASSAAAAAASSVSSGSGSDSVDTSAGPLVITPLNHASLLFAFGGKVIAIDPTGDALRPDLPKADYVFITDIHPDHLDPKGIDGIAKPGAVLVGPPAVDAQRKMGVVLKNGESHDFGAFKAEGVPMYNIKRGPAPGKLFHDKGRGDGYVITFGDKRVYLSGDTECTPEMKGLKSIDVAFVCMNLPYTETPDEAAECVNAFKPKVVYPYHYRGQDPAASFAPSVQKGTGGATEVRLRDWYAPR